MSTWNSALWGSGLPGGPAQAAGQILVSDILYAAYRIAGVLSAPGRGYSTAETADGLNVLNAMLDNWNTQGLTIYANARSLFSLVGGQQTYQIGPGAPDFDTVRPVRIIAAGLVSGSAEYEMTILSDDNWQDIPFKAIAAIPSSLHYEAEYPLGSINVWPVPSTANYQIALYLDVQAGQFSDASQQVLIPPGYLKAIQYNLAVELAIRFPRSMMHAAVPQMAADALADIKRLNLPVFEMRCDAAVLTYRGFTSSLQGAPLFAGAIGANTTLSFAPLGVSAGQTVVSTQQGWTNLMFFRNGQFMTPGVDFTANSTTQYTFSTPFLVSDLLTVAHN